MQLHLSRLLAILVLCCSSLSVSAQLNDILSNEWGYKDYDKDGYAGPNATPCGALAAAVQNEFWCVNPTPVDCDDSDPNMNPETVFYLDHDRDGYYTSTSSLYGSDVGFHHCQPGEGWHYAGEMVYIGPDLVEYQPIERGDCNDDDFKVRNEVTWYKDVDKDGYTDGSYVSCTQQYPGSYYEGYILTWGVLWTRKGEDCDDTNELAHEERTVYVDADGDNYSPGGSMVICSHIVPEGYNVNNYGSDVNDNDPAVYRSATVYKDADGDGVTVGPFEVEYGNSLPWPYVFEANKEDCNDDDISLHTMTIAYVDADGDGWSLNDTPIEICGTGYTAPEGYVSELYWDGVDQNDNDPNIVGCFTYYIDNDRDGYTSGTGQYCQYGTPPHPFRRVSYGEDCDDNDPQVRVPVTYWEDFDGDDWTGGSAEFCTSTPPDGYVKDQYYTDCDDTNPDLRAVGVVYLDNDGDGYPANLDTIEICGGFWVDGPYTTNTHHIDCDDTDPAAAWPRTFYRDADGDGHCTAETIESCEAEPPAGYGWGMPFIQGQRVPDCDDNDPYARHDAKWFYDQDGDGYPGRTTGYHTRYQCDNPGAGWTSYDLLVEWVLDCDDNNADVNKQYRYYLDRDGDGYGTGVYVDRCFQPNNYYLVDDLAATTGDLQDYDPAVYPGSGVGVRWYEDFDGDGFGNVDVAIEVDIRPDGYSGLPTDCNDSNNTVHPNVAWYGDVDKDGYGDGIAVRSCERPDEDHYLASELTRYYGDCYDDDATRYPYTPGADDWQTWVLDADNDRHAPNFKFRLTHGAYQAKPDPLGCAYLPMGVFTIKGYKDCNDGDKDIHPSSLWYLDADGDGYGTGVSKRTCSPGAGYVLAEEMIAYTGDCDDSNEQINPASTFGVLTWYRDYDKDGFGDVNDTKRYCAQPAGYVLDSADCDDRKAHINPTTKWYLDADGDGYGTAVSIIQCDRPENYYLASELVDTTGDCADADPVLNPATPWYKDEDGDGYSDGTVTNSCTAPADYYAASELTSTGGDCDDDDAGINPTTVWYKDVDGDGYSDGTTKVNCTQPAGYYLAADLTATEGDCNDGNAVINPTTVWYADLDGDGYSDGQTMVQCAKPAGHQLASALTATSGDCDDNNAVINPTTVWYADVDGDGFGDAASSQVACDQPAEHVLNSTDCDDNDPLEKPGQRWYIDADDDGFSAGASQLSCTRPADHKLASELTAIFGDCDDNDEIYHPQTMWYRDADQDGYSSGATKQQCVQPSKYYLASDLTATEGDCNDIDPATNPTKVWYADLDRDGYGDPNNTQQSCLQPADYTTNSTDCDDNDFAVGERLWYKDEDGDGYGDGTFLNQCDQPADHYTAGSLTATDGDCDDVDPVINPATTWYKDADGDGYSDGSTTVQCDQPVDHYLASDLTATSGDCDDTESGINPTTEWYADLDGDGYGDGTMQVTCDQPVNHYLAADLTATTGDCDDDDIVINPATTWYLDEDGDGYSEGSNLVQCSRPDDYYLDSELTATSGDCDDTNSDVLPTLEWFKDEDGDKYSDGTSLVQCEQPADHFLASDLTATTGDCDDMDAGLNPTTIWYEDADGDGYGSGNSLVQCTRPADHYLTSELTSIIGDCDDTNNAIQPTTVWYKDTDGDDYSDGFTVVACTQPAGYELAGDLTATSGDCDDDDALYHPATIWYVDADEDGYSDGTTIVQCERPEDHYLSGELTATTGDCDDSDALEYPGVTWYADTDNDGYSDGATSVQCERPVGYKLPSELTSTSGDCDDTNGEILPGAAWYLDADADGYGTGDSLIQCSRPANYYLASELTATKGDCDDDDGTAHEFVSNNTIASNAGECSSGQVDFTATLDVAGTFDYQWMVNGIEVGANSAAYSTNTLQGSNAIKCELSATGKCSRTSNTLTQTSSPIVNLTATNADCQADAQLTLEATVGLDSIKWYNNGEWVATNTRPTTYTTETVAGGNGKGNAANQLSGTDIKIFVNAGDTIYLADNLNSRIQKWAPGATSGITVAGGNGNGNAANQLFYARSLFVDESGNVYVGDYANHRIQKWAPGATAGVTVGGGNGVGSNANQTSSPIAILVDNGTMYISDSYNKQIIKWVEGQSSGEVFATNINALDIIKGPDGFIYASGDLDNPSTVVRIDQNGIKTVVAGNGSTGCGDDQMMQAKGIAFNGSGNLVTVDAGCNRIQEWDISTATVISDEQISGNLHETSLQIDRNDNIYVLLVDMDNGESPFVRKYSRPLDMAYSPVAPGDYTAQAVDVGGCSSVSNAITIDPTYVWYPDVDGDGYSNGDSLVQCAQPANYYAAADLTGITGDCDDNDINIHEYASSSTIVSSQGNCAGGQVTFTATVDEPGSYAYDWVVNNVSTGHDSTGYSTDSLALTNEVYFIISEAGHCPKFSNTISITAEPRMELTTNDTCYTQATLELDRTVGLDVIEWYLDGSYEDDIEYDPNSAAQQVVGSNVGTPLSLARTFAMDSEGNYYHCDRESHTVVKFPVGGGAGTVVAGTGVAGNGMDQLSYPEGIFIDSGDTLYVADHNNGRIMQWAPGASEGVKIVGGAFGGQTNELIEFPKSLHIVGDSVIYVLDFGTDQRITRWVKGATTCTELGTGHHGYGITVDQNQNVYYVDTDDRMLRKVAPDGTTTDIYNTSTSGAMDVKMNSQGQLVLPESYNYRVLILDTTGTVLETINGVWDVASMIQLNDKDELFFLSWPGKAIYKYSTYIEPTYDPASSGEWYAEGTSNYGCTGRSNAVMLYNELTWYADIDGDGYTDGTIAQACDRPTNYKLAEELTGMSDCDDNDAAVHEFAPTASIVSDQSGCASGAVTFTATVDPVDTYGYQWKVNGVNAGTDADQFVTSTLADGDAITCEVALAGYCPSTSNSVTQKVNPSLQLTINDTCIDAPELSVPSVDGIESLVWQLDGTTFASYEDDGSAEILHIANTPQHIYGLALDNDGDVYVSLGPDSVIVRLTEDLNTQEIVATSAAGSWIRGFAIDDTYIYYAEQDQHVIRRVPLGETGDARVIGGTSGIATTALNGFDSPTDVELDGAGNMYVLDHGNQRLLKRALGAEEGNATLIYEGAELATGRNIHLGSDGAIYFGSVSHHCIYKITDDGTITVAAGVAQSGGSSANKMYEAQSAILMGDGALIAADRDNGRIQRFEQGASNATTIVPSTDYGWELAKGSGNSFYFAGRERVYKYQTGLSSTQATDGVGVYTATLTNASGCQITTDPVNLQAIPTWYLDADVDGFGLYGTDSVACEQPAGYVDNDEDCDDGVFNAVASWAQIEVEGNGQFLTDGQTEVSIEDNTDFGVVCIGETTEIVKSFYVHNVGNVNLDVSSVDLSGADAAFFAVTDAPTTVLPGDSGLVEVMYTATGSTIHLATITINSNDCHEGVFTFDIRGKVDTEPVVSITASGTEICLGDQITLAGNGASSYSWSHGVTDNVAKAVYQSTLFEVVGSSSFGCVDTAQQQINVIEVPLTVEVVPGLEVCSGSEATLTATGGVSHTWTAIGSEGGGHPTNGEPFDVDHNSYKVVATDAEGCTAIDTVVFDRSPSPYLFVSNSSEGSVCVGETVNLTVITNGVSYQWYDGSTTATIPVVASTDPVMVTATGANGCATDYGYTVGIRPGVTASPQNGVVCAGDMAATGSYYTGFGQTLASYTWSHGYDNWEQFDLEVDTFYVITATDNYGCVSVDTARLSLSTSVTQATVTPNDTICLGDSITLTGVGQPFNQWSVVGEGKGPRITNGVKFQPTQTYTYSLRSEDNDLCYSYDTISVVVLGEASITAAPATSVICDNQTLSLTLEDVVSYEWSDGVVQGQPFTPVSGQDYAVTGTDAMGCEITGSYSVTVTNSPTVTSSVDPISAEICEGETVTLNGSGAAIYRMTNGLAAGAPFAPAASGEYGIIGVAVNGCTDTAYQTITVHTTPEVSATSDVDMPTCIGAGITISGTGATNYQWSDGVVDGNAFAATGTQNYFVTGTDDNGCTGQSHFTVFTTEGPAIDIVASATAVCEGESITLTASGADSYQWSDGVENGVAFEPSNKTYSVTGTAADGCIGVATIDIAVKASPSLAVVGSPMDLTICEGASITLTASGGSGYQWSNGVINGSSFEPAVTGGYSVTATNALGCESITAVTVTVNQAPIVSVDILPVNGQICAGDSVLITASGAESYVWSDGLINGSYLSPTSSTDYLLTATASNGCEFKDIQPVVVLPAINFSIATSPATTVCAGEEVSLTASGAATFEWSDGVVNGAPFPLTADRVFTVTATDANGCVSEMDHALTVLTPNVSVSAVPANATICKGDTIVLTAEGGVEYNWSNGLVNGVSFAPESSGVYSVTIGDADGCYTTVEQSVTVNELPAVDIMSSTGSAFAVCDGEGLTLSGTGADSYAWDQGIEDGVSFVPDTTTTYIVEGTDGNGCKNVASIEIMVGQTPELEVAIQPSSGQVCEGSNAILTANGAFEYAWSNGVENGIPFAVDQSGNYTVTGYSEQGCPGTLEVGLTMVPGAGGQHVQNVEACNNYVFNGQTLDTSGTYFAYLQNEGGCDSIIELNLTVHYTDTLRASVVGFKTVDIAGETFAESGTYLEVIPLDGVCDSIVLWSITVLEKAGDLNGDGEIGPGEIAGDVNSDGVINGDEIAGDLNGDGQIDAPEVAGDVNGDGVISGNEIAGDSDGDGGIANGEIAGDLNGDGLVDGAELAGDADGSGSIGNGELLGDVNGDGALAVHELSGDSNGDGQITAPEISGDLNGDGMISDGEIAGDFNSNGLLDEGELAGDINGDGVLKGAEIAGDTNGDGAISGNEISGDANGDGALQSEEITGDKDGNGVVDGNEIAGDINGDGQIDAPELAGDVDGDGILNAPELAGDLNGDGILDGSELLGDVNGDGAINEGEVSGDGNGNGQIDGDELAGDVNGDGQLDADQIAGDLNGNGSIDSTEVAGDLNGDGLITGDEIAGDTNGNGLIETPEILGDINGDGVLNPGEISGDFNGDGMITDNELAGDFNGNGVLDSGEVVGDLNGDGLLGGNELAGDLNGDGVIDLPELAGDVNGNGVLDSTEVSGDVNGNGVIDNNELAGDNNGDATIGDGELLGDANGDGVISDGEVAGDATGNGVIPDGSIAGDVNNDGTISGDEIAGDLNGDGVINGDELAGDVNGNGVLDLDEIVGDVNGDGVISDNEIAGDLNGSGSIDSTETAGDINGDGQLNGGELSGDVNGNGTLDAGELAGDVNGNGQADGGEIAGDLSGDGTIDGAELAGDADGSGVIDETEVAGDANGNGVIDGDEFAGDTNGDGSANGNEIIGDVNGNGSIDGDELANDGNNDGSLGAGELPGDADGSGLIDGNEIAGDSDNNGVIDGVEIAGDVNGDGLIDSTEVAGDVNGDGVIDGGELVGDVNGDSVIDGDEIFGDANGNGTLSDVGETSGDANNDGVIDGTELSGDVNGDGTIDSTEVAGDANGNGIVEDNELAGDVNGDGIINNDEIAGDVNGNGVIDEDEVAGDTNGGGHLGDDELAGDVNGNGQIDGDEVAGDANGDGIINNDEIAGDLNNDGNIFQDELVGDTDGDGVIGDGETLGDVNGDGAIADEEKSGDLNGDGELDCAELDSLGVTFDMTVSQSEGVLTVADSGLTYQWFYCSDTAYTAVENATNRSYGTTAPGDYGVWVALEGCVQTSDCQFVDQESGIESTVLKALSIHPNPGNGVYYLQLPENGVVEVYGKLGQLLFKEQVQKGSVSLDMTHHDRAVYLVVFTSESGARYGQRLVKN